MKNILLPLVDGFEEIEAVTCIDVLRRAGLSVVTA
ncbi:MAG: DJ-1 family protein, partial [Candidatus Aenigmatarchaeota archaeon]